MKKVLGILVVTMMATTALLAAPVGSIGWGTVGVTAKNISALTQTMALQPNSGVAHALTVHAQQAQADIQALYAIDTTQLSAEEMTSYSTALTNFNFVLRSAVAVLYGTGYVNEAQECATACNNLIDYVESRASVDPVFYINATASPVGAIGWGTVGLIRLPF